jgi:predicted NBD/HSP70 family sugar kinase
MSKPAALGIDIGGTKTLCVLVDKHCRTVAMEKFKTVRDGVRQFRTDLSRAVSRLKSAAVRKRYKVLGIGVGLAGEMDPEYC